MKEAIKQGNKNISLTTMGLKKRGKHPKDDRPAFEKGPDSSITGNPQAQNHGLANNLGSIDLSTQNPLGTLILQRASRMADIVIYHVEKNVAIDSAINKSL
jgi:hypothetical protein